MVKRLERSLEEELKLSVKCDGEIDVTDKGGEKIATLHTTRPLTFSDKDIAHWEHNATDEDYRRLAILNRNSHSYTVLEALLINKEYVRIGNVIAQKNGTRVAVPFVYVILRPVSDGEDGTQPTPHDIAALIREVPVRYADGTISTRKEIQRLDTVPAQYARKAVVVPYRLESSNERVHTGIYNRLGGSHLGAVDDDDHPDSKRRYRETTRLVLRHGK